MRKPLAVQGGFPIKFVYIPGRAFLQHVLTRSLGNIFRSLSAAFFCVLDSDFISVLR